MRLYLFEHCSLCFRVRMTAALKRLHMQETAVLDDDSEIMVRLVGKRVLPILVKNDGEANARKHGHGSPRRQSRRAHSNRT